MKSTATCFRVGRVRAVRRGKKGLWTLEFHARHSHCRKATGVTTLAHAQRLAAKLNDDLDAGRIGALAPEIPDAVRDYLASTKSKTWSKATLAAYRAELTYFQLFCEQHRHQRASTITPLVLEQYAQHRADSPGPVNGRPRTKPAATIHKARQFVTAMFRWLEQTGYLSPNPLKNVQNPLPRRTRPEPPRMQDATSIVNAAPPEARIYLKVLQYTGIRLGELQRLAPADIDFDAGFLHIRSTIAQPTKTGTSRKIPLHPDLINDLRNAVNAAGAAAVLFARDPSAPPEARRPLNDNSVLKLVKRLARSLQLKTGQAEGGWTPHLFRHCFESHAVSNRVPQRAVDVWLGHLGDGSTSRVYYHLTDEESLRLMRELKLPLAPASSTST